MPRRRQPLRVAIDTGGHFPEIVVSNAAYDYNDYDSHLELEGESLSVSAQTWTVAQAKAKFSEVIDRAMSEGPQTVTRKGRTAVVVVDAAEWQRKTKRVGTLAEFFARSPLRGSGLKLPRRELPRKVDL